MAKRRRKNNAVARSIVAMLIFRARLTAKSSGPYSAVAAEASNAAECARRLIYGRPL